jgi:hypothetical protein
MASIEDAVTTYILAKDGNRPWLMTRSFAEDAGLEMVVKTDAISFPSAARGLAQITEILVGRFAVDYENVYTFCLSRPALSHGDHFSCDWLVGMSAKRDGAVRVGCGRYDWHFGACQLVKKLTINIETMSVLPGSEQVQVFPWLAALPYPWCSGRVALAAMPSIDGLAAIRSFLQRAALQNGVTP